MTELLEFTDAHTYTKATFDANDFLNIGYEKSDRFLSYLEHLAILNYISADGSRDPAGVGRSLDEKTTLSILQLRLTESGRSFLKTRAKEAKSTLTLEKIADARREFEHSYKKVIQADKNGFQPALRSWARSLTSDSTLAGIMREVRARTEFDVQSCCEKALAAGTLPQGGKEDEDVLLAYFMVKKVLDGDERQRKFSDTWIVHAKLKFGIVGTYTQDLQKLVVDFKNKYVTFLSRFILNQLNSLAQTIPVQSEPSTEEKPMIPKDKIQFVQKLKHLKQFFEKYNEITHTDNEVTYEYEEWEFHHNRSQREVDEEEIRSALKKLIRLLSTHMSRFKLEYDQATRLNQQESSEFMRQEELVHDVLRPPECVTTILNDIIEPILFELEDLPSEESQNAQAIAKPFQHVKQGNTMPNYTKKFQVFISSTYMDLQEERKAAIHAILLTKNIPMGMENFSSRDRKQMDIIKKEIENADIFMLLLGGRYGTVPTDSDKSYIHQEYEYAKSLNKPIFTLRLSDSYLDEKIRTGSSSLEVFEQKNTTKYQKFKSELSDTLCNSCEDLKDITTEIQKSISSIKEDAEIDLKGWVRGDILDNYRELQQKYVDLEKELNRLKKP